MHCEYPKRIVRTIYSIERPIIGGALIMFLLFFQPVIAICADRGPIVSLKEMRERGVVMQNWEASCAAASVATVLTYGFRDAVSEGFVATRMLEFTDPAIVGKRGGFSLLDMKRFVENRGYTGQAYQNLSINDLRLFHAPIVPITSHGYNHYVVFNGVQGEYVLLADPAFGNRRMRISRFLDSWLNGLAFIIDRPAEKNP
jgi:uncharacterized protein